MPTPQGRAAPSAVVTAAAEQARQLLIESFTRLRQSTSGTSDELFPNGVELIRVKVEAGLTAVTKLTVEVRIAGPKPLRARPEG